MNAGDYEKRIKVLMAENEQLKNTLEKAQGELAETKLYIDAMQSGGVGFWRRNLDTGEVWYSPRWKEMLGYKERGFPNDHKEWVKRLHPHDKGAVLKAQKKHQRNPKIPYSCEYRIRHRDKSYRWIQTIGKVGIDGNGDRIFTGSHTDITETKEKERLYRLALETIPSFVFVKDRKLKFTFVNRALAKFFRKKENQILRKRDRDVNPATPKQIRQFEKDDRQVLATDEPLELDEAIGDGRGINTFLSTIKVPLHSSVDPSDRPTHVLGVATDVTNLKAEQLLFANLMDRMPDAIYVKDASSRKFLRVNNSVADICGLEDPKNAIGKTNSYVFGRKTARMADEEEARIVKEQVTLTDIEREYIVNREKRTYLIDKVPIIENRKVSKIIVICRNITELRKNTDLLQAVFDNFPHAIWVKDKECRYIRCNPKFLSDHGYKSFSEVKGKTDFEHWTVRNPRGRDLKAVRVYLKQCKEFRRDDDAVIETGTPLLMHLEERALPGEELRTLQTSKIPLMESGGEVYALLGIIEDITSQLQAERLSAYADRLHVMCSPIVTAAWTVTTLENAVQEIMSGINSASLKNINRIYESIEILRKQLLAFYQSCRNMIMQQETGAASSEMPCRSSIRTLVRKRVDDMKPFLPKHVVIDVAMTLAARRNPRICLNATQLAHFKTIIDNLLFNAVKYSGPSPQVKLSIGKRNKRFLILVSDNGCGISKENAKNIFESNYTTAAEGYPEGMGRGLAMVKDSADSLGWRVTFSSEVGRGSTFSIVT